MDIRKLGPGDEHALEKVGPQFDKPVQAAAGTRFLNSEGHHILVAYEGETVAGFVTGVEMTHPDKGTEMFLYELGVDPTFRGRGFGTALVKALAVLDERPVVMEVQLMGLFKQELEAAGSDYGLTRLQPV